MRQYKIYRLTFGDGRQYVGQTILSVARRIQSHIKTPVNYELRELLKTEEPKIEVLSHHRKAACATAAEKAAIGQLKKPINRQHVVGLEPSGNPPPDGRPMFSRCAAGYVNPSRKRSGVARTDKPTRCCWCREVKPAAGYGSDGTRFNGLSSRCKECNSAMYYARDGARRNGECTSAAYRAVKAKIQAAAAARGAA